MLVRDIMSSPALTVTADTHIPEVARLLHDTLAAAIDGGSAAGSDGTRTTAPASPLTAEAIAIRPPSHSSVPESPGWPPPVG